MAGAFLAIGSCISALTKNQVIAFIVASTICFLLVMSGTELVLNFFRSWAPQIIVDAVASLSFLTHFNEIMRGVISLASVFFYISLIAFFLFANAIVVDQRKAA
jgi:ABC-2 type transport system permease protein